MERTPLGAEGLEDQRRSARWPFIMAGVAVYAVVPLVMYVATNRQVSARAVGYASAAGLALAGYGFWRLVERDHVERLLVGFGIYATSATASTVLRVVLVSVATWVVCSLTFKGLLAALVFALQR